MLLNVKSLTSSVKLIKHLTQKNRPNFLERIVISLIVLAALTTPPGDDDQDHTREIVLAAIVVSVFYQWVTGFGVQWAGAMIQTQGNYLVLAAVWQFLFVQVGGIPAFPLWCISWGLFLFALSSLLRHRLLGATETYPLLVLLVAGTFCAPPVA
jgi:hypothetical protein